MLKIHNNYLFYIYIRNKMTRELKKKKVWLDDYFGFYPFYTSQGPTEKREWIDIQVKGA